MRVARRAAVATLLAAGLLVAAAPAQQIGTELKPQQGLVADAPGTPRQVFRSEPLPTPTPRADCGPGSRPEPGMQGRVPGGSVSKDGFTCNMTRIGNEGPTGGLKVERYVDKAGRECAYYDTQLMLGVNIVSAVQSGKPIGTAVLDMSDPTKPVRTATLQTPAMLSPHESLLVHHGRGLLGAVMGNVATLPGFVDLYDISADCRHPQLLSSTLTGFLGHESGWSADGNTFYATSLFNGSVTAVDVRDPRAPVTLWVGLYPSHGMTLSADGNRGYLASLEIGLQIVDTSEVQARKPNPQVREISRLSWLQRSIPQVALPMTIKGKRYLLEVDEFSADRALVVAAHGKKVGAARIIDISDEHAPRVVSNIRLAVHEPENRGAIARDPGARFVGQGYAAHYCNIPREVDPGIVACSMIASGLRLFDIRDPEHPKEIAYYVTPPGPFFGQPLEFERANWAMARPTFVPERGEVWYSDANTGFHALRVTNGVWPFKDKQCTSRRVFAIRVPARTTRVTVGGKRVRVRGRRARVDLRGLGKRTVTVRIVARTARGRTVTQTRRYRTCTRR